MDLINDMLGYVDPDRHITSSLQQGKNYTNYSTGYVSQVLPEVALMGGRPAEGTDMASVSEPLTGGISLEGSGGSHVVKGPGGLGPQPIKGTTHFVGSQQERLDKSRQEEEYQHIEDEYQRLLSRYNREYESALEGLLQVTADSAPVTPGLEEKVGRAESLGHRLGDLARRLEERTDRLAATNDDIARERRTASQEIDTVRARQKQLERASKRAGLSSADMQSLQGQYEDARLSVASHYYHYAVWIAVALVLGTLAVRILTGGDDISTGAITVVVALAAVALAARAVYRG